MKSSVRVKRTYNLDRDTVELVRSMVGVLARSQDAVIERSVRAMAREIRDREHTVAWAAASKDPEFRREVEELAAGFASDDRAAWDRPE